MTNVTININREPLSPREWPKASRGAAEKQIAKQKTKKAITFDMVYAVSRANNANLKKEQNKNILKRFFTVKESKHADSS